MTFLFTNIRLCVYLISGALSSVVLGFAAHFASLFLPHLHHDYTIFSLVVPAFTLFMLGTFLIFTHMSQPRFETIGLFVMSVLWLALGAWTVDRRDFLSPDSDCSTWGSQQTLTKSGTTSARVYCIEMKVVEAFSWMNFGIFAIFLIIIMMLSTKAHTLGRPYAWREPMLELGWFGEWPGYSGGNYSSNPAMMQPGLLQPGMMQPGMMQPGMMLPQSGVAMPVTYGPGGGYVVQQQPGHSVIIQPGPRGEAPTITQVAGTVSAV